jgi:hypothetical protein
MNRILIIAILPTLLLAAGCRSTPTRFYTLTAVAGAAVAQNPAPLQLRAVHLPAFLDRPERVSRISAQQMRIDDDQHWAESLGEMTQRVLSEDLAARLPAGSVLDPRLPPPPQTRRVVVDIQEFQPEPDGSALLQGTWTLHTGEDAATARRRTFRFSLPSGTDGDAQVTALDQLLGQLADDIARNLPANPSAPQ